MNRYVNTQTLEAIETVKDIDFIKRIKNWQEVIETNKTIQQLVNDGTIPTPEKHKFDGEKFIPLTMEEQLEKEIITVEEYNSYQKEQRASAYKTESDPIFFKFQRGEAEEQEWLDKIEEIKIRFAYKEEVH